MFKLAKQIKTWGTEIGFQQVGITDIKLGNAEGRLIDWLKKGFHGDMEYMARHGRKRSQPAQLVPGTIRIISVRMDYFPPRSHDEWQVLNTQHLGYISRYALGRDYHKLLRKRLQTLASRIEDQVGPFGYRVFTDSAPILEKPLAQKAGLGWMGKHTNILNQQSGSWFFLGEIYVDLPLPIDEPANNHCGRCSACIDICPTQAIIAPYELDARRCISYLTIELHGAIPEPLRALLGNRIYGCDDCQLICPWNRFAHPSSEPDFMIRSELDTPTLVSLFNWTEQYFLSRMEGSPIRRIGHTRWLRNIAVALGNAAPDPKAMQALLQQKNHPIELVREHVQWALKQHKR
jgi:epoxyqueuosine reductase